MPRHTGADEDGSARHRHRREAQQDGQTFHEKRPARFAHTSRHTEHADGAEPVDIESWTLKGGITRTKRVGKSWHRALGQVSGDAEEGE